MYVLFSPLMPKGVEHPDRGDQRNLGTYLFSPLMPKGVEHKVFEFFKEYADDEAVFPSDAERRWALHDFTEAIKHLSELFSPLMPKGVEH